MTKSLLEMNWLKLRSICHEITESFWQYGYAGLPAPITETYKDLSAVSTALGADFSFELAAGWIHEFTVTYNPCSPTISVPTQLYSINSLWASCGNELSGLFDPPYTLVQGAGLEGVSVTVAPPVSTSTEPISPAASKF